MEPYRSLSSGATEVAQAILGHQSEDGFFGRWYTVNEHTGTLQLADALMEAHHTFATEGAVEAAGRSLGYFYDHVAPRGASDRLPAHDPFVTPRVDTPAAIRPDSAVPMIFGYRYFYALRAFPGYSAITGDARAAEYAERVFRECDVLDPCENYDGVTGNFHVLIHLYRGLLSLWQQTGGSEILDKVVTFRDWAAAREWVSGGIQEWLIADEEAIRAQSGLEDRDEQFFSGEKLGRDRIDECCTVADWMMLNFELSSATGDLRYADAGSHVLEDHLRFGQAENGGWCGHRSLWGDNGSVWDCCCSHHGPRSLAEALRYAVVVRNDEALVGFYAPLDTRVSTATGTIHLIVDPEVDGRAASITVGPRARGRTAVVFRRPKWSRHLCVDGQSAETDELRLVREWEPGQVLHLRFEPEIRVVEIPGRPGMGERETRAAVMVGQQTRAIRESALGDFGVTDRRIEIGVDENESRRRITLHLPSTVERLITYHHADARSAGGSGCLFRVRVGGELIYESTGRGYVEVATDAGGEISLEIEDPSEAGDPSAGRWIATRALTSDGSITFLGACESSGSVPVRRLFISRAQGDDGGTLEVTDAAGRTRRVPSVALADLPAELEDPGYDLGDVGMPLLRDEPFRVILPLR